ncbi:MAG TPA: hypothetical protein VFZ66_27495 [Herpetosiphonaceae bacterium]
MGIQNHAIQDHGFTHEEFAQQTRLDVAGLPVGAGYVWQRANGTAWLLAIAADQGIPPETIAEVRGRYRHGPRSTSGTQIVELGVARELADGSRLWAIESVAMPADTPDDAIAAAAVARYWMTHAPHDSPATTIRHVWFHRVADRDASASEPGQPFAPARLDPALLGPTVWASCHTDDWIIDLGCETGDRFDATPFFASATDEELRKLIAIDFGGDLAADRVAERAETYDSRVRAMFAYIQLRRGMGFECYVDAVQARAWLQCHRPHVLIEPEEQDTSA